MELNFSTGSMIPGGSSYVGLDFQGSTPLSLLQHPNFHGLQQLNQPRPGPMIQSPICDISALSMGQIQANPMVDFSKVGRPKNSPSEEDEPSMNEEGADEGKKTPLWHRVKWTGSMVKLLITTVSYIDDEVASEGGPMGRRKCLNLQKKGKWRTVSKVMAERGHCVSPQQCEDKFNDLNKRYKKLNDILGRGTCCQVVENPALLDLMNHLSVKAKEEVKRIMSSKHLFYEEMCSYHNCNRLHLPPDPALQRSVQIALRSRDDQEMSDSVRHLSDEDDQDGETDDQEEKNKRMKQGPGPEAEEFHMGFVPHGDGKRMEQQRLQIEMEMLEIERQRYKWLRFSKKKDRELEKMKAENERMRLENEQMALELKQMEMQMKLAS